MGTFVDDFLGNFERDLVSNSLNVPSSITNAYSAYVALTNVAVGGTYVGKLVQAGRMLETTAVAFATGSNSVKSDWSGAANAIGALIVGGAFIVLAPATVPMAFLGLGVSFLGGVLSQALYETMAQHYPNLSSEVVDWLVESVTETIDDLSDAISQIADDVLLWAGDQIVDYLLELLGNFFPNYGDSALNSADANIRHGPPSPRAAPVR
ncbi:hypothetical protein [Bradyrhizobium prioriisuperbiae]|uniref:hypothetical protein n=1 Tax=Bradyrhizobium prioriisuperbiae TaxID=2854389 RepID=UPI0028E810D0|nr:hypothetical protein [Bradyrhizobium prioritasuperba]